MSKFLIWGTGIVAAQNLRLFSRMNFATENQIIGFVDNNPQKWGDKFNGYNIYAPDEIKSVDFDHICIWVRDTAGREVRRQIVEDLKIAENKLKDVFMPYKQKIYERYRNVNDRSMQEFLREMENDMFLSVYYYKKANDKDILHEVYYDKDTDLHYIYFESKRMYFKRDFQGFFEKGGKKVIGNIWAEQDLNSPHLYEYGDIAVKQGDVLVDAGVCEGNFALHHIEKVSKVYLVECDEAWMEALQYTFRPYKDKVVFCNKFLSDKNSQSTINLDTLVSEPVDFIKMDIEGAEIEALNGAARVFAKSKNIRCALCSYHKHGDEEKIIKILESYGMQTETSKGYMLFFYDSSVLENPELRRGIVRGVKS